MSLLLDIINWFCIVPCVFLKVPQIHKIFTNKDTKGVSLRAHVISCSKHVFSIIYHIRHNYSLLLYLEYPFLALQDAILIPLMLFYERRLTVQLVSTSIVMFVIYIATLLLLPIRIILILQAFQIPLGFLGKCSHLSALYQAKDSSNVSLLRWVLDWATCIGRIITSYVQVNDWLLISRFLVNQTLCLIGCGMVIYYSPSRHQAKKED